MKTTTQGQIAVRAAAIEGEPARFDGLAVPFNVVIDVPHGKERFVPGAFRDAAREINSGARIAYLNRHGMDGGVPIGTVTRLEERSEGLWFSGEFLDVPEVVQSRSQIQSGLNGVSIEFVPGKMRRKANVVEYYDGVRLAAIAGSYAPAYREATVALRNVSHSQNRRGPVAVLTESALVERRSTITSQIAAIRSLAETEDRSLDDSEQSEVATLEQRITNVDSLIASARAEAQRRDVERSAIPSRSGSAAVVTRSESVYGPHTGKSFFADLVAMSKGNTEAGERMSRHKQLVYDLAAQIEARSIESSELAGAYPTQNMPDLYVPDLAYAGPLSRFFATTPISNSNPITVPTFGTVTGDTGVQSAENVPLPSIDMTTAPLTITPVAAGGEAIVSRQVIDGANPGTDVIISTELRELLMRDVDRAIYTVLAALANKYTIADTAGTGASQSGRDLVRGLNGALADFYAVTRLMPAEGVFTSTNDWANLVAGEDTTGRPIMPFINPINSVGQFSGVGYQQGIIGGTLVEPAWAITNQLFGFIARKNDARQFKSTVLEFRLTERNGPQSIVFAIWQYFAFAILQPRGVLKYTYTNV
ncbi:MAG: phage major capsid protein [Chloroflexi bacterium]|nr:MAG: phage major capsid protein [Chloroflexota bacterium]